MMRGLNIAMMLMLLSGVAHAFEVSVTPGELAPGDPFVVRVTGVSGTPELTYAEGPGVGSRPVFTGCGGGCYLGIGVLDMGLDPGGQRLVVSDGTESAGVSIMVREGGFTVTRLELPERLVTLGAGDEARANREAEELRALWQVVSPALWDGPFIMPLDSEVSTPFGAKRIINGKTPSLHRGVDLRGKLGEPVRAAARGVAVYVRDTFYGGNTVVLDHGMGIYTVYMHLSEITVVERELLAGGEVVGLVGSTGRSTGPHLHYGVKVGGYNANPVAMTGLALW